MPDIQQTSADSYFPFNTVSQFPQALVPNLDTQTRVPALTKTAQAAVCLQNGQVGTHGALNETLLLEARTENSPLQLSMLGRAFPMGSSLQESWEKENSRCNCCLMHPGLQRSASAWGPRGREGREADIQRKGQQCSGFVSGPQVRQEECRGRGQSVALPGRALASSQASRQSTGLGKISKTSSLWL